MQTEMEQRLAALVDREEIFDLARRERFSRDQGDFATMRDCFHDEATIRTSWFDGGVEEYVSASRQRMAKVSPTSKHWVFPAGLQIVGDRATVESPAMIFDRTKLHGVEVDFHVFCRFFSRALRREGKWRLLTFEVLFERDIMRPVNPADALPVDWAVLATYRSSYRFLTCIQESRGNRVNPDHYGDDRRESLLAFYAAERQWVSEGRRAGGEGKTMSHKVGFIGLGTMGGAMAANLQKAGHRLQVHDINRKSADAHIANGAVWAASPMAAAADAEVIFISLPAPADVESVVTRADGILAGIAPGAAVFDLSTNSPTVVRKLEKLFCDKGCSFLDAPISGGAAGAISGKLALWVSGDRAAYDRFKPVMEAMGDQVSYIGEIGTATVAKLVHNLAGQALYTVFAEAFTLGVKAGLEPQALYDTVSQGLIGLRKTFDGMPQILAGRFDPPPGVFALRLAHKDVAIATALGRELGVPMRVSNLVLEEMTEAMGRGWGDRAAQVQTVLQMERSGASLICPPKDETKAS